MEIKSNICSYYLLAFYIIDIDDSAECNICEKVYLLQTSDEEIKERIIKKHCVFMTIFQKKKKMLYKR